jgi:hypothetical protein
MHRWPCQKQVLLCHMQVLNVCPPKNNHTRHTNTPTTATLQTHVQAVVCVCVCMCIRPLLHTQPSC